MQKEKIHELATRFRSAIEKAKEAQEFNHCILSEFPYGCCGITCILLAKYLHENGINTMIVSASDAEWSHEWLIEANNDVLEMHRQDQSNRLHYTEMIRSLQKDDSLLSILEVINSKTYSEFEYHTTDYNKEKRHYLVIDITGDQFREKAEYLNYSKRVYVGKMDDFHSLFEITDILEYEYESDSDTENSLYCRIMKYIS